MHKVRLDFSEFLPLADDVSGAERTAAAYLPHKKILQSQCGSIYTM
jgi:hypothetical protein